MPSLSRRIPTNGELERELGWRFTTEKAGEKFRRFTLRLNGYRDRALERRGWIRRNGHTIEILDLRRLESLP